MKELNFEIIDFLLFRMWINWVRATAWVDWGESLFFQAPARRFEIQSPFSDYWLEW